jgi:hypothetical protein
LIVTCFPALSSGFFKPYESGREYSGAGELQRDDLCA